MPSAPRDVSDRFPLGCPPGLGLEPWWSWAVTAYRGDAPAALEHLSAWQPTLDALPQRTPLEVQLSILRQSLAFQEVLRARLPGTGAQQRALAMPWFDFGLVRVGELVVAETLRRWASGGRKALAGHGGSLQQRAGQWEVLLARHAPALLHPPEPPGEPAHHAFIGLTTELQQALVIQGWQGDETAFHDWMRTHSGTGSGWQSPEQHAMVLWNLRRAELAWDAPRQILPRRQTLRTWWRGERWVDVRYDPPLELEARDGGPPAVAPRGAAARHTLTLSKAQARPHRTEPWLTDPVQPHVDETALTTWWLRPASALGEAEAPWQDGTQAARQAGGTHLRPVHLRIGAAVDVLPSLRKSALRARHAQRMAKRLILAGVVLAISSPLWVSWLAVVMSLVSM